MKVSDLRLKMPPVQGGDYRPHYPARAIENFVDELITEFQIHCRHKWHLHSVTEVMGGNVVNESWETCDHCGKVRQR